MAQKADKNDVKKSRILGVLLFLCGAAIAVSLVTHDQPSDTLKLLDTLESGQAVKIFDTPFHNRGGVLGVFIAYGLLAAFGLGAYFLPLGIWVLGFGFLFVRDLGHIARKVGLVALFLYLFLVLFSLGAARTRFDSTGPGIGGAVGHVSALALTMLTGTVISYTLVISLILGALIWVLPADLGRYFRWPLTLIHWISARISATRRQAKRPEPSVESEKQKEKAGVLRRIVRFGRQKKETKPADESGEEMLASVEGVEAVLTKRDKKQGALTSAQDGYQYPGIELLNDPPKDEPVVTQHELSETADALKETLATFGVELANNEVEIYPGPVITRFEFKPAPGVKISQVVNLADDLALAMKAKRIRIIAPIPGKSAIGVEIPNRQGQTVYLKDIIVSEEFQKSEYILPLAFGKTTSGRPFVADLAAMPHLLIAGATGSGKSVSINCMITSLLYRLSPERLRFILIDPKMLELTIYNDIPHLEKPVVTEMKYAEKVLGEAVTEMEDRYRQLAKMGVRNIHDYNQVSQQPLPYVVIFVDELADLMMIGSTRIETQITRLAQMARAVGIHLVLATQRPSVDVITGLIKANFSSRTAFQVATKVDSRTILDVNGAEKLLGKGDMLFMSPGTAEPKRVHGAYISGEETKNICRAIGALEYRPEPIRNFVADGPISQYDPAADAVFQEAVALVIRHKQGSVSLLQRRLGIGYQRAARLIDQLEGAGIVGPYDGSKAREVLVDEDYLREHFKDFPNKTQEKHGLAGQKES